MIRKAFLMQLKQGQQEVYKDRHDAIWPDLVALLKRQGVSNYSIFLHEDSLQLFAYVELVSESMWLDIAESQVCQKWWNYMKDIMETNDDNSPITTELPSLFYLG